MSQVYCLVATDQDNGKRNLTVFVAGGGMAVCDDTHPNFQKILELANSGLADASILKLFDVAETVADYFEALSDRVSVANGRVYFDGDEVNNVLTKQIVRFLDEGVEDWLPLVNFFENVAANPSEHSREQLYEWLDRRDFAITREGNFVAYKGVQKSADGGYESVQSGPAIVDGEAVRGHVPNNPGSIVEIARSTVVDNSAVGCAHGLHVGTHDYAQGWARGALLKVLVNPRDVVSVPTDCDAQKVRVCRYEVIDVTDVQVTSALDYVEDDYDCGDQEVYI